MEIKYKPGKAHYVVVTAIIIKDGKYLIAKRNPHEVAYPGMWTVPGGKLELDDYQNKPKDTSDGWYNIAEEVVKREVLEEVNLTIKNIDYLTSMTFIRPDGVPALVLSFCADYESGEVELPIDLTEYKWVTTEEAKKYDLIPGIWEELVMVDKKLKGERAIWEKVN